MSRLSVGDARQARYTALLLGMDETSLGRLDWTLAIRRGFPSASLDSFRNMGLSHLELAQASGDISSAPHAPHA